METNKKALKKAFTELRKKGYFARQNHTCCQTCGWSEVPDGIEKVVFYHNQDKEDLDKTGSCHLAWSGNGEEIVEVLKSNGIVVEWGGSEKNRIKININQ